MSLTVSRILKQQFRRRFCARIWYGRVEHELDVDVRGGADHRSGPDIPGTQVKSVCSASSVWKQMRQVQEGTV